MATDGLKLNHVNHVVTVVKDTQLSLKFYRDFLGIKQINRAGKTAHLGAPVLSARYELDILYRRAGTPAETPVLAPNA